MKTLNILQVVDAALDHFPALTKFTDFLADVIMPKIPVYAGCSSCDGSATCSAPVCEWCAGGCRMKTIYRNLLVAEEPCYYWCSGEFNCFGCGANCGPC